MSSQEQRLFFDSNTPPRWTPTEKEIRSIKASFCIPAAFAFIPYGDEKRIWTPATLAYDERYWDQLITRYKELGPHYSHYVINLAGSTYHNDYPHVDDDPARARRLILKLLNQYHLIPICCATNDEDPDVVLQSYSKNADVIDSSFVMWEMNGPCEGDSDRMFRITQAVRDANVRAITYLHFTAGHGSMGEPESYWWIKCARIGIRGLFSQDDGYNRNRETGDPQGTASGLEDTAKHLRGDVAGWEPLKDDPLDNIAFEQTTTPVYHKYPGWDRAKQQSFGNYLVQNCPSIKGYADGASI
jgi:hypothetical protein